MHYVAIFLQFCLYVLTRPKWVRSQQNSKFHFLETNRFYENEFERQPQEVFYKKKLFLKILQYFQKNTRIESLFLIELQAFKPVPFLRRDSHTGASMEVLRNF